MADKKRKKYLYSTGEFAKQNNINKRTLHYYNDIGLFRPEIIDENGYHYYSCFQTIQLELILILRKIGLSLEDIKSYTDPSSGTSFTEVMHEKKKLIDKSIEQLLEAKTFLQQKLDKLDLGLSAVHGKIEEINLPDTRILLSAPITGSYNEADFSVAADFSLRLKQIFGLYDNFGSRISVDQLNLGQFDHYDSFFSYGREDISAYDTVRPAGKYLRTFCFGDWDRLREVYTSILSYADTHHLILTGYAYEEGLNEMSLQKDEDYITMITVGVTHAQTQS